jgi:hypothetical protein
VNFDDLTICRRLRGWVAVDDRGEVFLISQYGVSWFWEQSGAPVGDKDSSELEAKADFVRAQEAVGSNS